jgi:hypothetical protein
VVLGLAGALLGLGPLPDAGAHGSVGTMGLEVTPGSEPRTARVRVLLEFANDRHLATGATVTATASGPDGAVIAPAPLTERAEGRYEAVLPLPRAGAWTVTVTATGPDATARADVTVLDAGAPAAPTTTTATATPDPAPRARPDTDPTAGGGPAPALIVGLVAGLVAALIAVSVGIRLAVRRRRSRG